MLYNGERVGTGAGPAVDVAVDPIDGTRLTAMGYNNALSVFAVAERGTMFDPSAVFYMDKLVVGPEAADFVDMRLPVKQNVNLVAKALDKPVSQVTVCVLDRPRHEDLVRQLREAGARVKFILDGVIDACTAAMRAPYADGSNAEPIWSFATAAPVAVAADAAGLQLAMHAIGDRASEIALDLVEECVRVNGLIAVEGVVGV